MDLSTNVDQRSTMDIAQRVQILAAESPVNHNGACAEQFRADVVLEAQSCRGRGCSLEVGSFQALRGGALQDRERGSRMMKYLHQTPTCHRLECVAKILTPTRSHEPQCGQEVLSDALSVFVWRRERFFTRRHSALQNILQRRFR